jgi:hypothetical protein
VPPTQYVPHPQLVHTRSFVEVGAVVWYIPATHAGDQAWHAVAFVVVLYVPEVQVAQARFTVEVGAVVWYCPRLQSLHAWHAVAELPSWSQPLTVAQSTGAVMPPEQYVPTLQLVHPRSLVDVGAVV